MDHHRHCEHGPLTSPSRLRGCGGSSESAHPAIRAHGSSAIVRVDMGTVDISARRRLRERHERIVVDPDRGPVESLTHALATSQLLRPGRSLRTRVLLETARVIYGAGGMRRGPACTAALPSDLRAALQRAVDRRRVRGGATLEIAPLARAAAAHATCADAEADMRAIVVDRSHAAVTVLLLGASGLHWARSVPSDDPAVAVRLLVDRALQVAGAWPSWWRLHDVTGSVSVPAPIDFEVEASSPFAVAAARALDGVPLTGGFGA